MKKAENLGVRRHRRHFKIHMHVCIFIIPEVKEIPGSTGKLCSKELL